MTKKDALKLIAEGRALVDGSARTNPEYARGIAELIYWATPSGLSQDEILCRISKGS